MLTNVVILINKWMVWALEISNSFEPIRYLKEMRFHVSVDSPNNVDFPSFLINKIIWQLSSVLGTILKIVKKNVFYTEPNLKK